MVCKIDLNFAVLTNVAQLKRKDKNMIFPNRAAQLIAIASFFLLSTSNVFSEDKAAEEAPGPALLPVAIEKHFLEGKGLVPVDPATAEDEGISREGPINSKTHLFFEGKISAYVFDVEPGRVRIDGLPYDEYIHVLEGRLILTPDNGEAQEFKKGDSLVLPEGYTGYWDMPERYREFVIINTIPE